MRDPRDVTCYRQSGIDMPIERYAKVLGYVILRSWPTNEKNGRVVGALGYVIQGARLATGNPALACQLKSLGSTDPYSSRVYSSHLTRAA